MAKTTRWNGGAGTGKWNTAGNWSNGVPATGDTVEIGGTTQMTQDNDIAADTSFALITWVAGCGATTITGNRITLTGNVIDSSSNNQSFGLAIIANAAIAFSTGNTLTLGGIISETGGAREMYFIGGGTHVISGLNTFSGRVQVGGTINVNTLAASGSPSSLGTGSGTNYTMFCYGSIASTMVYTGSGGTTNRAFYIAGSAGLTFTNSGSGTLTISGDGHTNTVGNQTLTVNGAGGDITLSGILSNFDSSNKLSVTKSGTKTLLLTNTNTYMGATTVTGGTFQLGDGNTTGSLATTSAITVTSPGILSINRSNTVSSGTDFKDGISGTGAVTQAGIGATIFTGTQSYSGATTVNAGTLLVNGATNASSDITVAGGALGGNGTVNGNIIVNSGTVAPGSATGLSIGNLSCAKNVTFNGGTYSIDLNGTTPTFDKLVITGTLALGSSVTTLTINNMTSGATAKVYTVASFASMTGTFTGVGDNYAITASWRKLRVKYNAGTIVLTDVTDIVWSGGGGTGNWATGANWTGGFAPTEGGYIIHLAGSTQMTQNNGISTDTQQQGIIFDAGCGAVTLTGNRILLTSTGGTSITNSSSNDQSIGLDLQIGTSLTATVTSPRTVTFGGNIINGGNTSLTKAGTGTITLNGNNTYIGGTSHGAGLINIGHANAFGTGTVALTAAVSIDNTSGNALTLYTNAWTIGGTTTTFVGTSDLIIPGGVTLNTGSARTFAVTGASARLTISGIVSGAVGLTMAGPGILYLNQASNTYTGQTLINGGTIEVDTLANISSACSLGTPTTTGNGTISFGSTTTGATLVYKGGTISMARYIKLNGTSGGATLVNAGTGGLTFNSASAWATPTNGAKTLTIASTAAQAIIFNAVIADTGSGAIAITMNGVNNSAFRVTAACTYTGATIVTGGTFQLGDGSTTGTLSTSSAITVTSPGILAINRSNAVAQGTDFAATIGGTGIVQQAGAGGLTMNGNNTFSGGFTIAGAGVVVASTDNNAMGSGTITFTTGSVRLVVSDGITVSNAVIINSATGAANRGLIENSGSGNGMLAGTVTINAAPANGGHFGGASTGKLTLAIVNSASAPVSQVVGTVQWAQAGSNFAALNIVGTAILADDNGIATNAVVTLDGGTINMTARSQTLAGLIKGAGAAVIGGGGDLADSTLTITGDCNFAGVITNSFESGGKKTKVGINGGGKTVTLSGTNTYTGTTSVSAGTLIITGSTGAGAVSVSSGATLGGTGTIGGTITPASGGIVAPGLSGVDIGQLNTAAVNIPSGAVFRVDLNGTTPTFDKLNATGAATLGGTLTVANYANPATGKVFTIAAATTITGTFNGLAENATFASTGRTLKVNYPANTVTLTDVGAPPTISGLDVTKGSAGGGTTVIISGTNLASATGVTFGGTAATITGNTDLAITVTTPAHAVGVVDVVVTTAGGTATAAGAFTYVAAATSNARVGGTGLGLGLFGVAG